MKNRQLTRYAYVGIGVLVLILLFFGVYFGRTHGQWFDGMTLGEKVKFWSDFGVSFGTIALAVITAASVLETQDVLRGEDRRFRQSKMPMVKVSAARRDHDGVYIVLRNDGDGPARNVRITFDAHTRLTWNAQGSGTHNLADEKDLQQTNELCSSFMPVGDRGECEWTFGASADPIFAVGGQSSISFRLLIVKYEDVFGAEYLTEHDSDTGGELVPLRFVWKPPVEVISLS